ncbi:MAG: ferrochelatase [Chitinophagaceae bacterium]
MEKTTKRGIVLMNLGSPDSTSVKDVRSYLMEFLMDERVIDYPYLLRKLLVGGIIVPFRASKSAEAYKTVWTDEGSPLIVITKQLQALVQRKMDAPVEIAMRYGNPSVAGYDALMKKVPGLEEVIAIPMYPHYAMSSYETAVEYAREVYKKKKYPFKLSFVKPYYNNEEYLVALSESIRPYLNSDYDHILFSYHGIPRRHILKSDLTGSHCLKTENCCDTASAAHAQCYRHQCLSTMKLLTGKLNLPQEKYSFSFQSRLGKEEWLRPYTDFRLAEFPAEGVIKLLVVCPAFVSDCLETLQEIAMEGRHTFMEEGGESFTLIPCLNIQPLWVQAITNWVTQLSEGNKEMVLN